LPTTTLYTQYYKGVMNIISIKYTLYYQIEFANEYQFTKCGKCFNLKTNREIKKCYNKGSIGYNIRGKFHSLTKLKEHLQKIPTKEILPF